MWWLNSPSLNLVSKHIIISFKTLLKNTECGNVNYSFRYIQPLRFFPCHRIVESYSEKFEQSSEQKLSKIQNVHYILSQKSNICPDIQNWLNQIWNLFSGFSFCPTQIFPLIKKSKVSTKKIFLVFGEILQNFSEY